MVVVVVYLNVSKTKTKDQRSTRSKEAKLNSILENLSSLESSQKKTAADAEALEDSCRSLEAQIIDIDDKLSLKASREELTSVYRKMGGGAEE